MSESKTTDTRNVTRTSTTADHVTDGALTTTQLLASALEANKLRGALYEILISYERFDSTSKEEYIWYIRDVARKALDIDPD